MADSSLDLSINIGANTQDFASQLQKAENLLAQFQSALKKSTNVGEINYLNTQINNLNTTIDTLNGKMSNMKKPSADATNALGNLSRVAQDAPYGFMGIANNLNPLLESFQRLSKESGGAGGALKSLVSGLTGPAGIGLALGVVSSLVVKFGKDIGDWISNTTELEKAQKAVKEAFYDSLKGVEAGIAKDEALVSVINNVTLSTQARQAALNDLKAAHKGNLELQKIDINDTAALTALIDKQSEALIRKAKVEGLSKIIGEENAKLYKAQHADLQDMRDEVGLLDKAWSGIKGFATGGSIMGFTEANANVNTQAIEQNKKDVEKYTKSVNNLKNAINEAVTEQYQLGDFGKTGGGVAPKVNTGTSTAKKDVDTSDLETLKKKQQLYKEDVYAYKEYADLITKEEEQVALKKAIINKASANEIQNIKEQAKIGLEKNAMDLGNSLDKIFKAADDKYIKDQKDFEKEKLANQLQASKDGLDIVKRNFDEESKLAGDDYEKKKEAIKKAMAEIKILMAFSSNPKAIQDLDKAYKDMDKQYKMLDIDQKQKDTKKLQDNYKKFADTIANDITQGFMVMFDAMAKGENPLQALGNYLGDLVKQFAAAIIQATIFKGIMSLLNLATGGGGGFLGGVLGGVGKLLGMAEGGVVSQPTLAMVGEGGQSEAVMPLNKLSNMMNSTFNAGAMSGVGGGGGNGQFVLKGNDLVLALQRSNYSLNLRRGNGI
jgi:hypothetical protein